MADGDETATGSDPLGRADPLGTKSEHLLLDELSDRLETLKLIRSDDEQHAAARRACAAR